MSKKQVEPSLFQECIKNAFRDFPHIEHYWCYRSTRALATTADRPRLTFIRILLPTKPANSFFHQQIGFRWWAFFHFYETKMFPNLWTGLVPWKIINFRAICFRSSRLRHVYRTHSSSSIAQQADDRQPTTAFFRAVANCAPGNRVPFSFFFLIFSMIDFFLSWSMIVIGTVIDQSSIIIDHRAITRYSFDVHLIVLVTMWQGAQKYPFLFPNCCIRRSNMTLNI